MSWDSNLWFAKSFIVEASPFCFWYCKTLIWSAVFSLSLRFLSNSSITLFSSLICSCCVFNFNKYCLLRSSLIFSDLILSWYSKLSQISWVLFCFSTNSFILGQIFVSKLLSLFITKFTVFLYSLISSLVGLFAFIIICFKCKLDFSILVEINNLFAIIGSSKII